MIVAFMILSSGLFQGCSQRHNADRQLEESTMTSASHVHHTIDYIEFGVTDINEAKRFYESAFGWNFTDYGPEYAGIQRHDGTGEVGGMSLTEEVMSGGPLVILYSDDLQKTLENVRQAGGTITKDPYSFPGGHRFHFRDPGGNELAVWAEAETQDAE